jgi:glycosyltransferase involved in cell wall biosynthesis
MRHFSGSVESTVTALVIAPQPFFTPRGTPFSVYYRTLFMAEAGVKVDLLTYGRGLDVDIPNVRIIRIPRLAWLGDVPVGPSLVKLIMDIFLFFWAIALLLRNRYDFAHAHEEAIFFLVILKPIFRFKLVYDMHSSLPQQLSVFNFSRWRIFPAMFRRLELISLRNSDVVVTICPRLAEYAEERLSDKSRQLMIENTIFDSVRISDSGKFDDHNAASSIAKEYPPSHARNRQLVVYTGTLEVYQGIDFLLSAFRMVLRDCPDAYLIVVGGDVKQVEAYEERSRDHGISDACLFSGSVLPNQSRQISQKATIHVSPRVLGINTPTKVYEQMASGIPIVATDIDAHTQVLDDDIAFLAKPNADSIATSLISALSDGTESKRRAAAAQRRFHERYSREIYVSKICELVDRVS